MAIYILSLLCVLTLIYVEQNDCKQIDSLRRCERCEGTNDKVSFVLVQLGRKNKQSKSAEKAQKKKKKQLWLVNRVWGLRVSMYVYVCLFMSMYAPTFC